MKTKNDLVVGWWSGGITSAVACRLAIEKYPNVRLVYIETGSHHPDTLRFKADCEKWYGQEIETIQNKKYKDHFDVILSTRYINGSQGARCTTELKKKVRFEFEKSTEIFAQVWGFSFEASEINRAVRMQEQFACINPLFPLIEHKLTKNQCAGILEAAGIEMPMMYRLGYSNNNCIGCVKGGAGYWNKIRVDFPEIFERMKQIERIVGASCLKNKEGRIYLDELDPKAGKQTDQIIGECGIFCQLEFADIISQRTNDILNGKISIYEW